MPIIPTTPFILLTAACYFKSSTKFHNWLVNNKIFGGIIDNYINKRGLPIKTKILTITFLWISIIYSVTYVIDIIILKILLLLIAMGVTFHLLKIKNCDKNSNIVCNTENNVI